MRLTSLHIEGFKRFGEATLLRVRGHSMAVLGPNESGKTSVLEALYVPTAGRASWIAERLAEGGSRDARTRIAQSAVVSAATDGLVEPTRVDELRTLLGAIRGHFPTGF